MTDDCKCKGVIGNLPNGDGEGADALALLGDQMTGMDHEYVSTSQSRILPGKCRDQDDTYNIVNDSNKTADITVTGAGGRNVDTAEQSSKWYALCIIAKSTDGTTAAFLVNEDDWSTSYTMPSGYDKIRRVGWVRNNSISDFLNYKQITLGKERHIKWEESYAVTQVLSGGFATSFTDIDCSALIPPDNIVGELNIWQDGGSGDSYVTLRVNGSTQSDPAFRLWSSSFETNGLTIFQEVDSGRIFEYKQFSSGPSTYIHLIGYIDRI
jgi:hypothetical protein